MKIDYITCKHCHLKLELKYYLKHKKCPSCGSDNFNVKVNNNNKKIKKTIKNNK